MTVLRQLQLDSKTEGHLDITIIDGDTVSLRDTRGRDITLWIPDLYGKRQMPSPQSIDLVGGAPNSTYYLYATEPAPPWGSETTVASSFRLLISDDGNLTFKHRLLFRLFTDNAGDIISTSEEFDHFTTDEMHVYVNSVTGDDANDGLTADTAKKTMQGAFDIIPYHIYHNVAVHLSGAFTDVANFEKFINSGVLVVIDGGDATTVLAGPYTADISSSSSIGFSGAGWTADQYEGYWVEILDGPAAGQMRLIQSHTTTTITPARNFSIDPGNANFRISRPSTSSSNYLTFTHSGNGNLYIQRLYSTGIIEGTRSDGVITLTHIVTDFDFFFDIAFRLCAFVNISGNRRDPDTFGSVGGSSNPYAGVGCRGQFDMGDAGSPTVLGSFIKGYWMLGSEAFSMRNGTRCRFMYSTHCMASNTSLGSGNPNFRNSGGYAITTLGPGLPPFWGSKQLPLLYLEFGSMAIGTGVDVRDGLGNGIEVVDAHLFMQGVVTSSPNANAGVWAHSGSVIHLLSSATPTVTGTAVGNLTVDNANAAAGAILDGPHTSDINSINTIGLSTLSWTVNSYTRRYVEILDGPAAGDIREVASNTATTITTSTNFSVDPGVGAQFRVIDFTFVGAGPTVTWATITGGVPFSDTTEMVVAKNYTRTLTPP